MNNKPTYRMQIHEMCHEDTEAGITTNKIKCLMRQRIKNGISNTTEGSQL